MIFTQYHLLVHNYQIRKIIKEEKEKDAMESHIVQVLQDWDELKRWVSRSNHAHGQFVRVDPSNRDSNFILSPLLSTMNKHQRHFIY